MDMEIKIRIRGAVYMETFGVFVGHAAAAAAGRLGLD
jgi:hypothetical protein